MSQKLIKPLFNDRLPIAACNTNNRILKFRTMECGKILKSFQRILYMVKITALKFQVIEFRVRYDEASDPRIINLINKTMSVAPASQGEK